MARKHLSNRRRPGGAAGAVSAFFVRDGAGLAPIGYKR